MRNLLKNIVLNSVFLFIGVAALPRPQVDTTTDSSVVSGDTTTGPGVANPFPNTGQGADLGDGSNISKPLKADTSSGHSFAGASKASATTLTTINRPVEVTGQLLGMPECNGTYYNAKWDTYFSTKHLSLLGRPKR